MFNRPHFLFRYHQQFHINRREKNKRNYISVSNAHANNKYIYNALYINDYPRKLKNGKTKIYLVIIKFAYVQMQKTNIRVKLFT